MTPRKFPTAPWRVLAFTSGSLLAIVTAVLAGSSLMRHSAFAGALWVILLGLTVETCRRWRAESTALPPRDQGAQKRVAMLPGEAAPARADVTEHRAHPLPPSGRGDAGNRS